MAGRALYGSSSPVDAAQIQLRAREVKTARQNTSHMCLGVAIFRRPSSPSTVSAAFASPAMSLKSKASAAAAAAASRFPRGSGSAAAFIDRGSSSAPTPNPGLSNAAATAASIHPQSLPDDFDTSPIHGRRGYPVGPSSSHSMAVMDSSMGLGISHGVGLHVATVQYLLHLDITQVGI
ncbi:hypothetical protein ABZP36_028903 [Zizania latifolia]